MCSKPSRKVFAPLGKKFTEIERLLYKALGGTGTAGGLTRASKLPSSYSVSSHRCPNHYSPGDAYPMPRPTELKSTLVSLRCNETLADIGFSPCCHSYAFREIDISPKEYRKLT